MEKMFQNINERNGNLKATEINILEEQLLSWIKYLRKNKLKTYISFLNWIG